MCGFHEGCSQSYQNEILEITVFSEKSDVYEVFWGWEDQKLIGTFFAEATDTKSEHILKSGGTKWVLNIFLLNRQNSHSYKLL